MLYCNDENYDFKMNWRYPLLKYNYTIPFEKLCIDTFIKNFMEYDVDIIVLNRNNIYDYVPDFPIRMKHSGYPQKKVIDLLGAHILEKYGGWYFDCDFYAVESIDELKDDIIEKIDDL